MNIINPNFVDVVPQGIEDQRAAVVAYVRGAGSTAPRFSFDAVREALGKSSDELPDGWIQQICQDAGFKVVP
jgi:hypothetical protein